ncbi:MAG: PglZ domain-containing protein, partial [Bacteroidia bacterium]|nr:PglZ domain-containing protein [Bacteroidia bacterium]
MENVKILWVDDEIELLRPHILFLNKKGMEVTQATNGRDAIEYVRHSDVDVVLLDENMPGINGLETLAEIKNIKPRIPVVMITKSEEEHIMNDAIGSQIADYLIKPVNPNQILISLKKLLSAERLVSQKVNTEYQKDFRNIGMAFFDDMNAQEWAEIYKKLVRWELELEKSDDEGMHEVLASQKAEANVNFSKFVAAQYLDWMASQNRPPLSPDLLTAKVFPHLGGGKPVFFILVDCLRYDQWKVFEPLISRYFHVAEEDMYYSILPTATQYARNAIFSGMFPSEIAEKFPKYWLNDEDEGGKNLYESELLKELLARKRISVRHSYNKVITLDDGNALLENFNNLLRNDLNVVVFNFIDLLSHARAEMNLIRELTPDERAMRSLSRSWFEHSSLLALFKKLREHEVKVVVATDHGAIRVKRPVRIIGDRTTTTNL